MLAYHILDINFQDDDDTVRKAYLDMVKRFSPEKSPTEFKVIRKAYELINTKQKRLEYFLFGQKDDISFKDYEIIKTNITREKKISSEKWGKLCQLYQKQKYYKK